MFETHFSSNDVIFFGLAFVALIASLFFFSKGKMNMALRTLIISGFVLRMIMAWIDPFLYTWDEQFHALVAKNMMNDMFHPMLVKEQLFPMDPTYWVYCHTWVHKPPLFLWQMAISMKIFGVNAFAVRFPSAVLSTLMIPAVYRMGKLIRNEQTGFIAALILAFSNIHINVVSGFINTDHNDVIFAAYILFSFWAFTEYIFSPRRTFIVLTALFIAAAVLTKWLTGFLVLGIWGIVLISIPEWRKNKRRWMDLLLASFIALLLSMPWFVYVNSAYPVQWKAALDSYSRHLHDSIAHEGTWLFHFDLVRDSFGWLFVTALLIGFYFFLQKIISRAVKITFLSALILVFTFYTFVATKMPLFCFIVYPLLILIASFTFDKAAGFIQMKLKKFYRPAICIIYFLVAFLFLNIGRLESYHTERDPKETVRKAKIANVQIFAVLNRMVYGDAVIFNCGSWNAVSCMFFSHFTAFDDLPSAENIEQLHVLKRKVAVFDDGKLPDRIKADTSILILKERISK